MTGLLAQVQNLTGVEARFVVLVDQALASPVVAVGAVVAALGVGAVHALAPGHGKALAAAYLVGGRGSVRDALLLGLAVAVMHMTSVVALAAGLGIFLRAGSEPAGPPDVTPELRVASGVVVLGLGVFLSVRQLRSRHGHSHAHDLAPERREISRPGLVLLGLSGGLLPSPSAFLVLVTAAFSGRLLFGLLLVAMFSVGLAATLTVVGLAVVRGRQLLVDRVSPKASSRLTALAAVAGAVVVLVGGVFVTATGFAAL